MINRNGSITTLNRSSRAGNFRYSLIQLSDHQASKMESFQQHDDSINATKRLAIDKKDTSNDGNRDMKCLGAGKVDIWQILKSVKQEVLLVIRVKKWAILLQSADLKAK